MDSDRFDRLARALSSRRSILGGLLGGGAITLGLLIGPEPAAAHNALPACRKIKQKQRRAACIRRARRHNASHGTPGTPGCTPSCAGKNCGSNGCGGSCGSCGGGRVCSNPAAGGTCRCPAVTCNGTCCGGGQQCFGAACWPDSEELAFITLLNDHRAANGRAPLTLQNQLGAAAELHSQDQATNNFSNHTGSDGSSPDQRINRAGYTFSWWYENIYFGGGTASEAFAWWRQSSGHNANMLSTNVTQFGIGRARSSAGVWYWTTTFGSPG